MSKICLITRYFFGAISVVYLLLAIFALLRLKSAYRQDKGQEIRILLMLIINGIALLLVMLLTYVFGWALGIPVTQLLGFDPVSHMVAGIRELNLFFSSSTFTNLILLMVLIGIYQNNK